MRRVIRARAFVSVLVIAGGLLVSGCEQGIHSGDETAVPGHPLPTVHLWQYLRAFGEEPSGYAAYTYALVGRSDPDSEAARKFSELVRAIQSSTVSEAAAPETIDRETVNLFLIPAAPDTDRANLPLAQALVSALQADAPPLQRPGPFLVTTHRPIRFGDDSRVDFLYVDLSDTHPEAIAEVVAAYKRRVFEEGIEGIERLRSLRLAVLNLALVAEDSIGFASAARAQLGDVFRPE